MPVGEAVKVHVFVMVGDHVAVAVGDRVAEFVGEGVEVGATMVTVSPVTGAPVKAAAEPVPLFTPVRLVLAVMEN